MSLGIVVLAIDKRKYTTFGATMDSVLEQDPDEVVVIADFPWQGRSGWRHLTVAPITRTTIDGLIKRDAGWVATTADTVMFLCDDHRLAPDFVKVYREKYEQGPWDVLAPARYVMRDGEKVWLNVGQKEGYVGGHGGVYRRAVGNRIPWTTTFHHPNYDLIHTLQLRELGARVRYADQDLAIRDIEPGAEPWR